MYKTLAICAVTLVYFLIHAICQLITPINWLNNLLYVILSALSTWFIFFSGDKEGKHANNKIK